MGISDKDMADAIAKRDKHIVGWTDPRGVLGITVANAMIAPPPVNSFQGGSYAVSESDLQSEAMLAPLSAVVDMWTVRWGGDWVAENYLLIDDFWRLVLLRLLSVNKVEKHYKMNQQGLVYRIIE
jgi:hypothetical protein